MLLVLLNLVEAKKAKKSLQAADKGAGPRCGTEVCGADEGYRINVYPRTYVQSWGRLGKRS